ncbi:histidine kinase N-terminal 7TM domain-containing diguanylate cyclase [Alkalicoccobacillus porphyridii]|uniref:Diguanylate cyclase n=1 Tax=Alkalicoccobacillus porphyridii TaxID=2597270 RepID=A0A554A120_9BACI|nr:diguanylate cyclase [Alkalicoccobacillus porphyridii]TSB47390.1 diguanylate cyclase [Alkalicoccobacillus porphyridii]
MTSNLTAYIALICTSGVFNLFLCIYVFLRRHHYTNIALYFIVYTFTISVYCFASAFGLMGSSLEEMKFLTVMIYIGLPFASPLGLLFIMKYLGINTSKKSLVALFAIPVISFFMVATNDFHHLHYKVFEIDPVLGPPFLYLEIGIWYGIYGTFTFACMFVAFLLLLFRWKETAPVYWPQMISLMFGQLIPMVTAFIYLQGWTPPGVDPVPMVLWLTSILYLYAIQSSRMFSVMPVAKAAIFNSINDGVLVLDAQLRLIEYNQAFKGMFDMVTKSRYGLDFQEVWNSLSGADFPLELSSIDWSKEAQAQLEITHHGSIYQVRITPLKQLGNQKGLLFIFTEMTELKRLQMTLEHRAYHDELTQIYNRRAFFENCEQELLLAKQKELPYTLIIFDIDYFKKVNDTYGHDVGDQLLAHVVYICQTQLGEDILFARYGGEEFVLGLRNYTAVEGEMLANQLRVSLESEPLLTQEIAISVTISSGVAETSVHSEESLDQLIKKADQALYEAKRNGRNQVKVYDSFDTIYQTNG